MERTYVIPLRKGWLKVPRYKRAKRAMAEVHDFLVKHMKSDDVRVGVSINLLVWKHGMKNPPSRVKVNAVKDDKGVVRAELFGVPVKEELKTEKKAAKKTPAEKSEVKAEANVETVSKPVEAEKPKTAKKAAKKAAPKAE